MEVFLTGLSALAPLGSVPEVPVTVRGHSEKIDLLSPLSRGGALISLLTELRGEAHHKSVNL